jgi:hypothetical protein
MADKFSHSAFFRERRLLNQFFSPPTYSQRLNILPLPSHKSIPRVNIHMYNISFLKYPQSTSFSPIIKNSNRRINDRHHHHPSKNDEPPPKPQNQYHSLAKAKTRIPCPLNTAIARTLLKTQNNAKIIKNRERKKCKTVIPALPYRRDRVLYMMPPFY